MRYWSLDELEKYFDSSRTGVWKLRKDPKFPQPLLVQGRVMFRSHEVMAWDSERREREAAAKAAYKAIIDGGAK